MRHLSAWVVGAVVAAVVIGCGPGKELPDASHPRTTEPGSGQPKVHVPRESDPAAKEVVDRAIKAFTQNTPDRLSKGKLSKVTAAGTMKLPVGGGPGLTSIPTTRTLLAEWPDKVKVTYELKGALTGTQTQLLRRPFLWSGMDRTPSPIPDPALTEDTLLTDGLAQHWLPLLFPLAEPGAVVFDLHRAEGDPPADRIKFATPNRPIYQLSFDPQTGHLTRVEYHHTDVGGPTFKVWALADHKPGPAGLVLPTRMESIRTPERLKTGEVVEQWAVEAWEFPEKFDDSAFEPPK